MEDTRIRWERAYAEALDHDTWGQVEEAIEGYQRLQVAAAAEYVENVLLLPMNRRDGIGKLASALKYRIQELSNSADKGIGLVGMKNIKSYMKEIIITDTIFPLAGLKPEAILGVTPLDSQMPLQMQADDEPGSPSAQDGTLRGPPAGLMKGDQMLTIVIEKWGFKDVDYVDPRVTVSVRDEKGELLEAVQETPVAKQVTPQYVVFDQPVYVQTALNRLPDNAAIYLEFKHWKQKKNKKSCKAYCYIEMDEVKSGPMTLEVYKKPTIYVRKRKPSLLTVKPLYLHLRLSIDRV